MEFGKKIMKLVKAHHTAKNNKKKKKEGKVSYVLNHMLHKK
jgi:hypothetical protein